MFAMVRCEVGRFEHLFVRYSHFRATPDRILTSARKRWARQPVRFRTDHTARNYSYQVSSGYVCSSALQHDDGLSGSERGVCHHQYP